MSEFYSELSDEDILKIKLGDDSPIDSFLIKMTDSLHFLISDIICPEILKEAKDYITSGVLTEEESLLKYYIEKTKAHEISAFDIETIDGEKMRCLNDVQHDGKVTVSGGNKLYILFNEIDKVMLDDLPIYEKSNYIFH